MKILRSPRPNSKPAILAAAINLARKKGLRGFSRRDVADICTLTPATISYHYLRLDALRREVVEQAIKDEILSILADARSDRNSAELYRGMPAELKQKIAAYIAK